MDRSTGRRRLVSVGATLLGYALLALGVATIGITAVELLLSTGESLAEPVVVRPQDAAGLAAGVAGYLLLRYVVDRDAETADEPDVEPSAARAADAYQFDS